MPRVNLCKDRRDAREREDKLVYIIKHACFDVGGIEKAYQLCGITRSTFRNRLKCPGDFTRDEIRRVISALKIPDEEIRPYL